MKPNRPKQKNDVFGRVNACVNYSECPLCYGCRNYSSSNQECLLCVEERKTNICNTERHKPKPISMLVQRNKIILKGDNN